MSEENQAKATQTAPAQAAPKPNVPVTMRQLLECGVHFGHQTRRWNPKMKKYIFTARNDIHVIDLQQTVRLINVACEFIRNRVTNGGTILFVGTKKQAQEAIAFEAKRVGMPFVNQRWLGGFLTNKMTLDRSILKFRNLEKQRVDGIFDKLSKKEASRKQKQLNRLAFYLEGVKDMRSLPSALFVVDTKKEHLAIKEAHRLGIPVIGVVDTNADPTEVTFPIPGNDDAIRAIKLLCSVMADAVALGSKNQITEAAKRGEATPSQNENDELLSSLEAALNVDEEN